MGENNKIADEFYRTLQRFHNCKPKFKGNGDLANVEFFMLIGLSMLLEQKESNEKEEGVTLGEIMKVSGMSVSAASKKISILENKGYVNRRPSQTDRRNIYITLTGKGREVCEKEKENKRRFIEALIEKMGDEDVSQLLALSNRAFEIMESLDC
ncbi:MAG: MarR family winged helix-turn-helix transcriptional regulator [Lachnospiraceae bacterium]